MSQISHYFLPAAYLLSAQLMVETLRAKRGKPPMGWFVICALALVLMDILFLLLILFESISDLRHINFRNGLILFTLSGLASTAFGPAYFMLARSIYAELKTGGKKIRFLQAFPSAALAPVFFFHEKKFWKPD